MLFCICNDITNTERVQYGNVIDILAHIIKSFCMNERGIRIHLNDLEMTFGKYCSVFSV